MTEYSSAADVLLSRADVLAQFTEEPGRTTRRFLSHAMLLAMAEVRGWMEDAGMETRVDNGGNLRGVWHAKESGARRLVIGSHLDTVPNAGRYDGIFGVLMGLALVELLKGERLATSVEVIAFSEEEGVRFGVPFIGSRAVVGELNDDMLARLDAEGKSVADVIHEFGLDPRRRTDALLAASTAGYVEFHIEQGPVLEAECLQLGVVDAIAGQSRFEVIFHGQANHAGTTPMHLRHDAMAAAAEWISAVEALARKTPELAATASRVVTIPGAGNVIAGEARTTLDVRHTLDAVRQKAVAALLKRAEQAGGARGVTVSSRKLLEQAAVPMDAGMIARAEEAIATTGAKWKRMSSGAGHDAMVIAPHVPSTMIFVSSPGGLSHHPDEGIVKQDVEAALHAGFELLKKFSV